MTVKNQYLVLNKQVFSSGAYSLVPIRYEDRYKIMQWRNEQIYHLRQNKPLTAEEQDNYFNNVILNLFDKERPDQVLFSYLENDKCIGYGGLVHINWIDKNAEISFIMDTTREKEEFQKHWSIYLGLIEEVAFNGLSLHKIYTYAFDLRPHLYDVLEQNAFKREAILKEHCFFNGAFKNVNIHSKVDLKLKLRRATMGDMELTYQWAIDPEVRRYSFTSHTITTDEHTKWFFNKISASNSLFFIAEIEGKAIGSIRFDVKDSEALISYLINPGMHGKGYSKQLLYQGVNLLFAETELKIVKGVVLESNIASVKAFEGLGYKKLNMNDGKITFVKDRL